MGRPARHHRKGCGADSLQRRPNDYEAIAIFVAYRMLKGGRPVFQKIRAKLDSARILVLATGYEPVRLKLDETLERGKTVKRIEMKPLPPLELTIVAPDGHNR